MYNPYKELCATYIHNYILSAYPTMSNLCIDLHLLWRIRLSVIKLNCIIIYIRR